MPYRNSTPGSDDRDDDRNRDRGQNREDGGGRGETVTVTDIKPVNR